MSKSKAPAVQLPGEWEHKQARDGDSISWEQNRRPVFFAAGQPVWVPTSLSITWVAIARGVG
eukprot:scaffold291310_cov31-Tisochrysis_lutea.AAC.3